MRENLHLFHLSQIESLSSCLIKKKLELLNGENQQK